MTSDVRPAALTDHVELSRLLNLAGAHSIYLADLSRFEANVIHFLETFRARYPRTEIGYSYKTNYLPDFIRIAHDHGARTEVVSRMELDYAEQLGLVGPTTLLNGPVKQADDIARAFDIGATVILDSHSEVLDAIEVAGSRGTPDPARVAIRCQLPRSTPGTRFGIDLRGAAGQDALARIDAAPSIELIGLHVHHSGDRTADRYSLRIQELIDLHTEVLAGRPLEFLDVGGGFGSPLPDELVEQLGSDNPAFDEYAEAVTAPLIAAYGQDGPLLIAEPGMGLLAETTTFVSRVVRTKTGDATHVAVVDGSLFNVKPLRSGINLPGTVSRGEHEGRDGRWRFVGHTCMEIDVLRDDHHGTVAEGDLLVMPNLGAYTTVLNAPFISPLPPIVTWHGDHASAQVVRPQLGADHLARTFGSRP